MYRSVLTEVKAGQMIALPVYNPNDWRVIPLVQSGAKISHAVLTRMLDLGVRCIWVQDEQTSEVDRRIKEDTQEAIRVFSSELAQFWGGAIQALRHPHPKRVQRTQILDSTKLQGIIRPLSDAFHGDRFRVASIQALARLNDKGIDRMLLRVMLSLCLAIELESEIFVEKLDKIRKYRRNLSLKDYQSAKDITSLGVGAALMDFPDLINMTLEDGQPVSKDVRNTRKEILIREIDQFGIGIARMIIRIRHQNYDGTGSPKSDHEEDGNIENRGLRGDEIHLLGRITRVVDLFVGHLLENNSWIAAIARIQEDDLAKVDPIILDSFLLMIPPFPVGSQVVLNDNSLAVVVKENRELPCRPKVVKIGDSANGDVHIDLEGQPVTTLFIETALDAPGVDCMDHYFSEVNVSLY